MNRAYLLRGIAAAAVVSLVALFAPVQSRPFVLVQPYIQPGDGRVLTGKDVKVITWLTDQQPGDFVVEFQTPGGQVQTAKPVRTALDFEADKAALKREAAAKKKKEEGKDNDKKEKKQKKKDDDEEDESKIQMPPEKDQHYFKYSAYLDSLPFNSDVRYSVKLGDQVIREATFRTRATADKSVRCTLLGDMAEGLPAQFAVAYQMALQKPDFMMALGDIVYPAGRANQYLHFFFGTYNDVKDAGPKTGAPLMASVPFYAVLGNHDISAKLPATPDAFAAYYFFSPPKGGPGEGPWATKLGANEVVAAKFRAATADSYPNLDAYSFDNGPAHFLVLNDNVGMKIDDPAFLKWMAADLKSTAAKWKFVCYHIPCFESSFQHYGEQQMRPLQPLMEECGVDIAFAGHVHNYQRSVPLLFAPEPPKEQGKEKKGRLVTGKFTLDTEFDGIKNTRPKGVIHIVAGGGGASLYKPGLDVTVESLKKDYGPNYAEYTAYLNCEEHSFVLLDLSPERLELKAISDRGKELDRIIITKGK
jgi:predicted phosphodiesterase